MIKGIPKCFDIFTRKNKKYYVSLPIPCIGPLLSRGYQTVTIIVRDVAAADGRQVVKHSEKRLFSVIRGFEILPLSYSKSKFMSF